MRVIGLIDIFLAFAFFNLGLAANAEMDSKLKSYITYQTGNPVIVESFRPKPRYDFPDPDRRSVEEEAELVNWIMIKTQKSLSEKDLGFDNPQYQILHETRMKRARDILLTERLTVRVVHRATDDSDIVPFIGFSAEDDPDFDSFYPLHRRLYVPKRLWNKTFEGGLVASTEGRVKLNLTPKAIQIISLYRELAENPDCPIWRHLEQENLDRDVVLHSLDAWFKGFIYHELDHVRQGLDVSTRRVAHAFKGRRTKVVLLRDGFARALPLLAEEVFNVEVNEGDPFKLNRDLLMNRASDLILVGQAFDKVMKSADLNVLFRPGGRFGLLLRDNDFPLYYLSGDGEDARDVLSEGNPVLSDMTLESNLELVQSFVKGKHRGDLADSPQSSPVSEALKVFHRGFFTGALELFMRGQYVPPLVLARLQFLSRSLKGNAPSEADLEEIQELSEEIKKIKQHPRFQTYIGFYPHLQPILNRAEILAHEILNPPATGWLLFPSN